MKFFKSLFSVSHMLGIPESNTSGGPQPRLKRLSIGLTPEEANIFLECRGGDPFLPRTKEQKEAQERRKWGNLADMVTDSQKLAIQNAYVDAVEATKREGKLLPEWLNFLSEYAQAHGITA